jgi:nitrate/nitrite-specific signal transduction histidine kinase
VASRLQIKDGAILRDVNLELPLALDPQAPVIARAAVSNLCTATGADGQEVPASLPDNLLLLVSEVVTNAVLHSNGPAGAQLVLTANVVDDSIRVTVTDSGAGCPGEIRRRAGGYGLYLLDKLASSWGVEQAGGPPARTTVWFELSLADAG